MTTRRSSSGALLVALVGNFSLVGCLDTTNLGGEDGGAISQVTGEPQTVLSVEAGPVASPEAAVAESANDEPSSASEPSASEAGTAEPSALSCAEGEAAAEESFQEAVATRGDPSTLMGLWTGDSEGERIMMQLDAQGRGTIQLGTERTVPLFDDPDVGFVPEEARSVAPFLVDFPMIGGFAYDAYVVESFVSGVEIAALGTQPWGDWCRLQEPVLRSGCDYGCIDATGGASEDGETCFSGDEEVDCGKLNLCFHPTLGACHCTAEGCVESRQLSLFWKGRLVSDNELSLELSGVVEGGETRAFRFFRE